MTDLSYTQDGMFTRFLPESKAGEAAWAIMADQLGGVAAVLTMHVKTVIYDLRRAGYKVSKAKKVTTEISDTDLLKELGIS